MASFLQSLFEGKIDFEGQRMVEQIARVVLIIITAVSFILGFVTQSLRATFATFTASAFVLALVVIPPWPMFNRNPVKWLPVKGNKKDQ